jgi:uncharacterized protein YegP (UPF0339 family)
VIEWFSRRGLLGRRWYFRVKADNGEIVAPSEAYNSPEAREKGTEALCRTILEDAGFAPMMVPSVISIPVWDGDEQFWEQNTHITL